MFYSPEFMRMGSQGMFECSTSEREMVSERLNEEER